jgi:hypothetical protein
MEVCFLASGERLAVLDEEQFHGQSARDVKRTLADGLGVSRFLDLIIIFFINIYPLVNIQKAIENCYL